MHRISIACLVVSLWSSALNAEAISLREPADATARRVECQIRTTGEILVGAAGEEASHPLNAAASFEFLERRLPSAGRDARSLRSAREFASGRLQTTISDRTTTIELPEHLRLIVAEGEREGVRSWCALGPMTRDTVDLLELPGDPLSLVALLPLTPVNIGDSWHAEGWAAQMLATIEAVESADITCTLREVRGDLATIDLTGLVRGQRLGAASEVTIAGNFTFDIAASHVSAGSVTYQIVAKEGVVNPGMKATVQLTLTRTAADTTGRLDDAFIARIPLDPPQGAESLVFDAAPWGVRFHHAREWYIFQAILDTDPKVVILRLIENGGLISQCNLSPVPAAAPGQHTPMEQFQSDIQRALGQLFGQFRSQETFSTDAGGTILRVVVDGQYVVPPAEEGQESRVIPITWIYYLCASASGSQVSAVFAIDPELQERLGEKDLELIRSLQFYEPAR
jgi:hypothetical protein